MLLLRARNIVKSYGDRNVLEFDEFKLYSGDRVGIVGINGAGKSTFLEIVSGRMKPDEGEVNIYSGISYIKQLDIGYHEGVCGQIAKEFGIDTEYRDHFSGGEKMRLKIASELSRQSEILMADEPTSNLDVDGIKLVEEKIMYYNGAVLLISHDRELLDRVCNSIMEIEDGRIKLFKGNYSQYKTTKDMQRERELFEYRQYVQEQNRLKDTIVERRQRIDDVRKAPKRMGLSEARLHRRASGEIKEKLARNVKAVESRLERMEKKEKPKDEINVRLDALPVNEPVCNTVAWCKGLTLKFGQRVLFENAGFEIPKGSKTAILGGNGTGKTTLMNMIAGGNESMETGRNVRIGYFFQDIENLNPQKTILETVKENSIHPEWVVRTVLARLLFKREEVFKKIHVLSGGERVKILIASLLLSDANFLLLDEPTNYLDLFSMEALQSLIKEYRGTILFASHDRRFVSDIATRVIRIDRCRIQTFEDGYGQYIERNTVSKKDKNGCQDKLILEMRLAELAAKLALPGKTSNKEQLEKEYNETVKELKLFQ